MEKTHKKHTFCVGARHAVPLLFLCACLCIHATLFAQTTPTTDFQLYQQEGHRSPVWDQLVQAAYETEAQGNMPTSFVFLKKAFEEGCLDALVMMKLGLYFESKKNLKDALSLFVLASTKFEQQYQNHQLRPEADAHAARLAYELKDFPASQKFVEQAILLKPNDFSLLFLAGQLQRASGKLPEARTRFEQALQTPLPSNLGFDPQIIVLRELVAITERMQDDDACLNYSEALLKLVPNDKIASKQRERIVTKRNDLQNQQKLKEIIMGK